MSKYLKRLKKRKAALLGAHLERLGAAFCRDVPIEPKDAVLVSKHEEDGSTKYWFERKLEKPNMSELHPDVKVTFDAAYRQVWGPPFTEEELAALKDVMEKYKKDFDEKTE